MKADKDKLIILETIDKSHHRIHLKQITLNQAGTVTVNLNNLVGQQTASANLTVNGMLFIVWWSNLWTQNMFTFSIGNVKLITSVSQFPKSIKRTCFEFTFITSC